MRIQLQLQPHPLDSRAVLVSIDVVTAGRCFVREQVLNPGLVSEDGYLDYALSAFGEAVKAAIAKEARDDHQPALDEMRAMIDEGLKS